jgi:hypothetical protein
MQNPLTKHLLKWFVKQLHLFIHLVTGTKFSEDCYRYGGENSASDEALAKAASLYGGALRNIEKEYEDFNRTLSSQVTVVCSFEFISHTCPL